MDDRETVRYSQDALCRAGADRAQCVLTRTEKHTLTYKEGRFTLLRTAFDSDLSLAAIRDHRMGTLSLNRLEREPIDRAADEVLALADASQPDEAYDVAERQEPRAFSSGDPEPDRDRMFARLHAFLETARQRYPAIQISWTFVEHTHRQSLYANTNGIDFADARGMYDFFALFTSREDGMASSQNYGTVVTRDLDREFLDGGNTNRLLRQSVEQTSPGSVPGTFTGDVVLAPEALFRFIEYIRDISLADTALIAGTSVYRGSIGRQIADPRFTLRAHPVADEMAETCFVTADGYEARNGTVIESGVLKSFLLSQYGARKTGHERAPNHGACWVVDAGDASLDEMVGSVDRGLLLCRFAGGYPSNDGDFSGVARNSYYIEGGEMKGAITETMVSGNLAAVLRNIRAISRDRLEDGFRMLPWVLTSGVTISGKGE